MQCPVCFELVESAMDCEKCGHFLCESHVSQLDGCPKCRAQPLQVRIDVTLRRLVDLLQVRCQFCHKQFNKGDLKVHMENCTGRPRCGFKGCEQQASNKEDALRHIMDAHGDILWNNFSNPSSVCIVV